MRVKHHKTDEGRKNYKNRCRIRNYKKGREHQTKKTTWAPREIAMLIIWDTEGIKSDREIAKELGRSVQAVQDKRVMMGDNIPQNVQSIIDYFTEHGIPVAPDS